MQIIYSISTFSAKIYNFLMPCSLLQNMISACLKAIRIIHFLDDWKSVTVFMSFCASSLTPLNGLLQIFSTLSMTPLSTRRGM